MFRKVIKETKRLLCKWLQNIDALDSKNLLHSEVQNKEKKKTKKIQARCFTSSLKIELIFASDSANTMKQTQLCVSEELEMWPRFG